MIEKISNKYPEMVAANAILLHQAIINQIKNCTISYDEKLGIIGYGFGMGYKETICTIIFSKKNVKLGLINGATLPDKKKLLKGTGKVHKYIEINHSAAINSDLNEMLEHALDAYFARKTNGLL
jgi:hypothetical protein